MKGAKLEERRVFVAPGLVLCEPRQLARRVHRYEHAAREFGGVLVAEVVATVVGIVGGGCTECTLCSCVADIAWRVR